MLYALVISGICTLIENRVQIIPPEAFANVTNLIGVSIFLGSSFLAMLLFDGLGDFFELSALVFLFVSVGVISVISSTNLREGSLSFISKYLPYAGVIGFLMGLVVVLANMQNPESIKSAAVFSYLTVIYSNIVSVTIKLFCPQFNESNGNVGWQYSGFVMLLFIFSWLLLVVPLMKDVLINGA